MNRLIKRASIVREDYDADEGFYEKQALKLQQERNDLKRQISSLAKFNYAREPGFVRDRTKLREMCDEVAFQIGRAISNHAEPTLRRLNSVQSELANDLSKHEEMTESLAQDFLQGKTNYDEFITNYIRTRKNMYIKRSKVDKLTEETSALASSNITTTIMISNTAENSNPSDSPVPAPRQRKRVSFGK